MSNIVAEGYQSEVLWLQAAQGELLQGTGYPSAQQNRALNAQYFLKIHCRKKQNVIIMPGMMDKGSDYLGKGRSNGTKSPSNASNGHFSDESGSDDEHGIASNTHI